VPGVRGPRSDVASPAPVLPLEGNAHAQLFVLLPILGDEDPLLPAAAAGLALSDLRGHESGGEVVVFSSHLAAPRHLKDKGVYSDTDKLC
jgi:hypothetical protein